METNELSTIAQTISAVTKQIEAQPLSVILIFCLLVAGGIFKLIFNVARNLGHEMERNGFEKSGKLTRIFSTCCIQLIPLFVLATGAKANLLIADPGKVAQCPYPDFVIAMWGVCLACVAWIAHATIGRRLEKYLPFLGGTPENGHGDEPAEGRNEPADGSVG